MLRHIISFFIGLISGIFLIIILKYNSNLPSTFYDFNLINIIEILMYGIIVVLASFYFGLKHNNLYKRKELSETYLNDAKFLLQNDCNFIDNLANKRSKDLRKKILIYLRNINNKKDIIKNLNSKSSNKYKKRLTRFENNYKELKNKLSGDDWDIKEKYSNEDVDEIQKIINNCISDIDYLKFYLYY